MDPDPDSTVQLSGLDSCLIFFIMVLIPDIVTLYKWRTCERKQASYKIPTYICFGGLKIGEFQTEILFTSADDKGVK